MPKPKSKRTSPTSPIDRQKLLDEFDMVLERDYAVMAGVDLKTLRNRPTSKKPRFVKLSGRDRATTRQWIRDFHEMNPGDAPASPKPVVRKLRTDERVTP